MANPTQPGIEVLSKEFKRDDNDTVLCTDRVELKFDGVTLGLAQSWENGEELAPIFSGACWAGTVVWQAALDLCDYMSEHHRGDLVGASVVELGCGIGVPGMIARLLGANVVLTEQDELLSLLGRNLEDNFKGERGEGIRHAALDWERKVDTDDILASLKSRAAAQTEGGSSSSSGGGGDGSGSCGGATAEIAAGAGGAETLLGDLGAQGPGEAPATAVRLVDPSVHDPAPPMLPSAVEGDGGAIPCEGEGERVSGRRPPTRLEFILCADCVFEPLYGDSWKALAKVMGRLSDAGTTVLCSVERRGDDGVPRFLDACEAEGFERRMVYRSAPGAPAPIELYELSKGGQEGFRGVAVESEDVSSSEVDGGDGDDDGEGCSPPGEEKAGSTEGSDDVIER